MPKKNTESHFMTHQLMLRAHELHSVLGPGTTQQPQTQVRSKPDNETYCFKCSMPGFTSCTCPSCSSAGKGSTCPPKPNIESPQALSPDWSPDATAARTSEGGTVVETRQTGRKQGIFQGERTFHRGNPPPRH